MADPAIEKSAKAAQSLVGAIPFSEMTHTSRLFLDFIYSQGNAGQFYPGCGCNESLLIERAKYIAGLDYPRDRVANALEGINKKACASARTFENIETLSKPGSVAIVTGQQAGLFTGPLYSIHKALTVIKLTESMKEKGVSVVPVFWVASEDHDFEEVSACRIIDREGHIKSIRYEPEGRTHDAPVGNITICGRITDVIDEMKSALPQSEFSADIESILRECYSEGTGFAEAFSMMMQRLLKDYGVVILDPLDQALKEIASPIYIKAIERSDAIFKALDKRSHELEEAGYHSQIHISPEMAPLFLIEDGARTALIERDGRFHLKGDGRSLSANELIEIARRTPELLSPNVALRPVVQDYLLPTVAYIGGPAELAYFGQVRAVYEELDRPGPCVIPRASMTIIEARHAKTLSKYSLKLQDFFEGLHHAVAKVVENSLDRETADTFDEAEREFDGQFKKLEDALKKTDVTLVDSAKHARDKVFHQLEHLRTRFVHSSARREEAIFRQVERAFITLYPDKVLQERELNVVSFLSRYGISLIDRLYEAVDVGFPDHKLVYI